MSIDSDSPREAPGAAPKRGPARRIMLAVAAAVVVLVSLGIWGAFGALVLPGVTPLSWRDDAYVLTGEFRADGSCAVLLDGQPLADVPAPRTRYEVGMVHGAAPEGYDVHRAACAIGGSGENVVSSGSFWVWGAMRGGQPLRPGRYTVRREALPDGDTAAMEMALFHPRFQEQRASLEGYDGWVEIVRADNSAVAGTFRIVARRNRFSAFE